jgi:hypothetical protein
MEHRMLGRTGVSVSKLCVSTEALGFGDWVGGHGYGILTRTPVTGRAFDRARSRLQ